MFFLVNFQYVANVFYLKIRESSYSAQLVVQMLFWNHWKQESAWRFYFNISREKPAHIHTYTYITFIYPQIYCVTLKNE